MTVQCDEPAPRLGDTVAVLQSLRLADGRRMSVRTWPGTGDETIVFLHGLLDSSEGWADTCERRDGSDGRPTLTRIAFDLPGFGSSDAPREYTIDAYARDVAAGLSQLGVRRFSLVGHSLGGAVATRLSELMADQIDAIVLLAPAGYGPIRLADVVSLPGIRDAMGLGLPLALANRHAVSVAYRAMVTNGHKPERELLDRIARSGPQIVAGTRAAVRAIAASGHGSQSFCRRVIDYSGPVIAIWGDHDRLVNVNHRHALQRAIPQARIEVWKGMGHHPQRERLEDLLMVIRRISAPDQQIAQPRVAAAGA